MAAIKKTKKNNNDRWETIPQHHKIKIKQLNKQNFSWQRNTLLVELATTSTISLCGISPIWKAGKCKLLR